MPRIIIQSCGWTTPTQHPTGRTNHTAHTKFWQDEPHTASYSTYESYKRITRNNHLAVLHDETQKPHRHRKVVFQVEDSRFQSRQHLAPLPPPFPSPLLIHACPFYRPPPQPLPLASSALSLSFGGRRWRRDRSRGIYTYFNLPQYAIARNRKVGGEVPQLWTRQAAKRLHSFGSPVGQVGGRVKAPRHRGVLRFRKIPRQQGRRITQESPCGRFS